MNTDHSLEKSGSLQQPGKSCCRGCGAELRETFVDLGLSPLCQNRVFPAQLNNPEVFYPLHVHVCTRCWLVQLGEYVAPSEIFSDYAYFSSYSSSWLKHAADYVQTVTERFGLGHTSMVYEIASNDGYLLRNFVERGIPCLGIEPAENVAEAARAAGVPTVSEFFGVRLGGTLRESHGPASLVAGNNVLAHVPDLHDFIGGLALLLKDDGIATFEFPHLMQLIAGNQFDTIYHEHFSYLSLAPVERVLAEHGLRAFDVTELPTHGGSLRLFVTRTGNLSQPESEALRELRTREAAFGLHDLAVYRRFQAQVHAIKRDLLATLIDIRAAGKTIAGYGAPGKGNTLLNYCGIRTDFLDFTVDRSPHKQGTYTPGTRIPVLAPEVIFEARPDYLLVLPWNLGAEIMSSMQAVREWGCKFILPIPEVTVV
jgi:hypothetical protein